MPIYTRPTLSLQGNSRGRGGAAAKAFAAVALAALLMLVAPASASAFGSISGTVSQQGGPIAGIEVCASAVTTEDFECTLTDDGFAGTTAGEYTITGLAPGSYRVEFWAPDPLNYVPQYFDAKSSWGQADQVSVVDGVDRPGVDATLEEGGVIEGRAVDATSKAGIGGVFVCAFPIDEIGFGRCGVTNNSGDYFLYGLGTDSYEVAFFPGEGKSLEYLPQYYEGKSSWFEATPVAINAGSGVSGIDAELQKAGRILGTVTNAAGGAAVSSNIVCVLYAFEEEKEIVDCTETDASGRYEIGGLLPDLYKVWFSPDSSGVDDDYFEQFYDAKPTFASASPIAIDVGSVLSGIDARLVSRLATPVQRLVAPPVASPTVKPALKPKPGKRCRKGRRKVKRKGKIHCVKVSRKARHGKRRQGRGRLYRMAAHRSMLPPRP